jgi:hypothetical protein
MSRLADRRTTLASDNRRDDVALSMSPTATMGTVFSEITDARTPIGGFAGGSWRRESLRKRRDLVSTPGGGA